MSEVFVRGKKAKLFSFIDAVCTKLIPKAMIEFWYKCLDKMINDKSVRCIRMSEVFVRGKNECTIQFLKQ